MYSSKQNCIQFSLAGSYRKKRDRVPAATPGFLESIRSTPLSLHALVPSPLLSGSSQTCSVAVLSLGPHCPPAHTPGRSRSSSCRLEKPESLFH